MKIKSISLVFVFVFILVLIGFFLWRADPFNLKAPKDQKLIAIFRDHLDAFTKLQQMAIDDSLHGRYFCEPYLQQSKLEGSKIDEPRLHEYQNLLSKIRPGIDWGIDGRDNVVRFIFAGGGFLLAIGPEWVKGIEYIPSNFKKEGNVVQDLDNARNFPEGVYLRPIGSNWFIFYQRTDD